MPATLDDPRPAYVAVLRERWRARQDTDAQRATFVDALSDRAVVRAFSRAFGDFAVFYVEQVRIIVGTLAQHLKVPDPYTERAYPAALRALGAVLRDYAALHLLLASEAARLELEPGYTQQHTSAYGSAMGWTEAQAYAERLAVAREAACDLRAQLAEGSGRDLAGALGGGMGAAPPWATKAGVERAAVQTRCFQVLQATMHDDPAQGLRDAHAELRKISPELVAWSKTLWRDAITYNDLVAPRVLTVERLVRALRKTVTTTPRQERTAQTRHATFEKTACRIERFHRGDVAGVVTTVRNDVQSRPLWGGHMAVCDEYGRTVRWRAWVRQVAHAFAELERTHPVDIAEPAAPRLTVGMDAGQMDPDFRAFPVVLLHLSHERWAGEKTGWLPLETLETYVQARRDPIPDQWGWRLFPLEYTPYEDRGARLHRLHRGPRSGAFSDLESGLRTQITRRTVQMLCGLQQAMPDLPRTVTCLDDEESMYMQRAFATVDVAYEATLSPATVEQRSRTREPWSAPRKDVVRYRATVPLAMPTAVTFLLHDDARYVPVTVSAPGAYRLDGHITATTEYLGLSPSRTRELGAWRDPTNDPDLLPFAREAARAAYRVAFPDATPEPYGLFAGLKILER